MKAKMSYIWNEFNIKTFPAETIVFRNGEYCSELSTLPNFISEDFKKSVVRNDYIYGLQEAQLKNNIKPFMNFISEMVLEAQKEYLRIIERLS